MAEEMECDVCGGTFDEERMYGVAVYRSVEPSHGERESLTRVCSACLGAMDGIPRPG